MKRTEQRMEIGLGIRYSLYTFMVIVWLCISAPVDCAQAADSNKAGKTPEKIPMSKAAEVVSEVRGAPIEVPMTEAEVAARLARFAKRYVDEHGMKDVAGAIRRFQEEQRKTFPHTPIIDPEYTGKWLGGAGRDEVEKSFFGDFEMMKMPAMPLYVERHGIRIRYIVDQNGTEGNAFDSDDLPEVIAQMLAYPPDPRAENENRNHRKGT